MRRGQFALAVEPLAVRQGEALAGRPESSQPHPPVEVLPEVHHEGVPAAHRPHGGRPELLYPPDRGYGRTNYGNSDVTHDCPAPGPVVQHSVVYVRVVHRLLQPPAVLPLAADEVGRADVGRRDAPARLAGRHDPPALLGLHLELRAQRHVAAVLVRRPRQPDLAAVPPVGQQDGEHVAPRPHE